jgi:putative phosphoesterase
LRIAIFSDVHGNCVALEAVLSDIKRQSIDEMVCLGDAIQGGSQPTETVSRLRELKVPTVMGNSDAWLLTGETASGGERVSKAQLEVRAWSLSKLKEKDLDFIRQFKSIITLPLGDQSLVCFHGSPASFDDLIFPTTPEEVFQRLVSGYGNAILCGGHAHLQHLRRFKDSFYFNPGSVGFSYDHSQAGEEPHADSWAEYAIISAREKCVGLEFRRVPFDAREWTMVTARSGRPYAEKVTREYSSSRI